MFQEFSLVPYLNVAHNIFLGREFPGRLPGTIDRGRMQAEAARILATLGAGLDPRTPVHRLGVAQQQMVEIAKALSQHARILVMDEPTAALSDPEIQRLFASSARSRPKASPSSTFPTGFTRSSRSAIGSPSFATAAKWRR